MGQEEEGVGLEEGLQDVTPWEPVTDGPQTCRRRNGFLIQSSVTLGRE